MRGLSARRIAATALCAGLLAGVFGPVAVAADTAPDGTRAASRGAPLPGADALSAQVKSLGELGGVLTPVTAAVTAPLNAVLRAEHGQLPAAEAQKLITAVKDSITRITAPATTPPGAATAPVAPPDSTVVPPVKLPTPVEHGARGAAPASKDLKSDALARLQKALDSLLAAVTSGDVSRVVPAVTGALTAVVDFLAATLLGSGLPAPHLPGLSALPSLPPAAG